MAQWTSDLQQIDKIRKSDATVCIICEKSGGLHLRSSTRSYCRQAGRPAGWHAKFGRGLKYLKACCRSKSFDFPL